MVERFGNPNGFVSVSLSLLEHAALGERARQEGARQHGRKEGEAEPLPMPIALDERQHSPATGFGPFMIAGDIGGPGTVV